MLKYLNETCNYNLVLLEENQYVIKLYVGSYFSVHPDFKSYMGGIMTLICGAIQYISLKHKINTWSITEANCFGDEDAYTMILWTWFFLEDQGYDIDNKILYQYNKYTIIPEKNGRKIFL